MTSYQSHRGPHLVHRPEAALAASFPQTHGGRRSSDVNGIHSVSLYKSSNSDTEANFAGTCPAFLWMQLERKHSTEVNEQIELPVPTGSPWKRLKMSHAYDSRVAGSQHPLSSLMWMDGLMNVVKTRCSCTLRMNILLFEAEKAEKSPIAPSSALYSPSLVGQHRRALSDYVPYEQDRLLEVAVALSGLI